MEGRKFLREGCFMLLLFGHLGATLHALPSGAVKRPSSLHTHAADREAPLATLGLQSVPWPQVVEQSWPDCSLGPDNYKYYFLGTAPAGTKELHIELRKGWSPESGPLLCLRRGGPPLPSNKTWPSLPEMATAAGWAVSSSDVGPCASFTADAHLALSSEHVLEGPWWLALFTDPSDTRFQSKMIQRGSVYPFSMNVTIAGCGDGQQCQRNEGGPSQAGMSLEKDNIELPSKPNVEVDKAPSSFVHTVLHTGQAVLSTLESGFHWPKSGPEESQTFPSAQSPSESTDCYLWNQSFPLYVASGTATLHISLHLLTSLGEPLPDFSALVRWGAPPLITTHGVQGPPDQTRFESTRLGRLKAEVPNAGSGWWYLRVVVGNATGDRFCVEAWDWTAVDCEKGRAGPNCTWPLTRLGRILTGPSFAALYCPTNEAHSANGWFPLQPDPSLAMPRGSANNLLPGGSRLSDSSPSEGRWWFMTFSVPESVSGQTLNLEVRWPRASGLSERVVLFSKLGAIPSANSFDFQAKFTEAGPFQDQAGRDLLVNGTAFLQGGQKDSLKLTVQYPSVGTWYVGLFLAPLLGGTKLKSLEDPINSAEEARVFEMRVRVGGCPRDCSGHGSCGSYFDEGLTQIWSTCKCDRTHGGADCGVVVLSPDQESRHVLALTLSNAAAIPAAAWAYTHKAYPEWIVFTCGGLASAVYHMCDAGSACLAQYGTLQFADFLLSFLAVVLTCLYLAPLPPFATAPAQLSATLLLAVLAKDNATSGWSLVVVVGLGALALALGWGLEAAMERKRRPDKSSQHWGANQRQVLASSWLSSAWLSSSGSGLASWLLRRYRWPYVLGGLLMLGLAAASWTYEAGNTYWIWHSLWHVSIFMCPFFLLCATSELPPDSGASTMEYSAVLADETDTAVQPEEQELRVVVEPAAVSSAGSRRN